MTQKAKMTKWVITIVENKKTLYFQREEVGLLDPKTHETIRKPTGYFVDDIKEAKIFYDTWHARLVASAYEGASVERVRE